MGKQRHCPTCGQVAFNQRDANAHLCPPRPALSEPDCDCEPEEEEREYTEEEKAAYREWAQTPMGQIMLRLNAELFKEGK